MGGFAVKTAGNQIKECEASYRENQKKMRLLSTPQRSTLALLAISAGAILTALAFEHIGGYKPCPLCLQERYAYYFAILLSALAIYALSSGRTTWAATLIAFTAIAYLANSGLGLYHSGVEWHYWSGPSACSGTSELGSTAGNFLESLKNVRVIRCDEAPWRLFGLSFAGWSTVISFSLSAFSACLFNQIRRS